MNLQSGRWDSALECISMLLSLCKADSENSLIYLGYLAEVRPLTPKGCNPSVYSTWTSQKRPWRWLS